MPQLRRNILTGKWVVVAVERSQRPHKFKLIYDNCDEKEDKKCPFCSGNEHLTPPETLAYGDKGKSNSSGWKVRAFDNKFPAFTPKGNQLNFNELYYSIPALGRHEVVVHSPSHTDGFSKMNIEQIDLVLRAITERIKSLYKDKNVKHISIITNHKSQSGASMPHPHSQLFASPIIPSVLETEMQNFNKYSKEKNNCIVCDQITAELKMKENTIEENRVVADGEGYLIISPFAARLPFETWILPKHHSEKFEDISDGERFHLAEAISYIMQRYNKKLNDPPYNMIIHSAPKKVSKKQVFHWHIEIIPRLTILAGFELASGMTINIVPPEKAAQFLTDNL